jgi:hypothetical protein
MSLRNFPWWTPNAVKFVNNILTKDSLVLEFGSGGSTPWLCQRVKKVTTIEHNSIWFKIVQKTKCSNLDLRLINRPYNTICDQFKDEFFDFIMVDGRDRVLCFTSALRTLKKGGWIGLDDSTRIKYKEAWDSVLSWKKLETKNLDPKEAKTGSRNTWFWEKPSN